jgi:hypothetical protein
MKLPPLTNRQRLFMRCAPFNDERIDERGMRSAVFRVRKSDEFAHQRGFDRAVAELAKAIPIPPEVTEWESKQTLIAPQKWSWKKTAQNPVVVAIGIAVGVITGIFVFNLVEHMNDFPGEETARKHLATARGTRPAQFEPLQTDAGAVGDLFFMKHRLEHYDVPSEFAEFRTTGSRVFDDEEGHRVAQIQVVEKHMQFLLFPAEKDPKTGAPRHFSGWRFIDHENWTGVVEEHNGVCFMAAVRGGEKDLAPYLKKPKD